MHFRGAFILKLNRMHLFKTICMETTCICKLSDPILEIIQILMTYSQMYSTYFGIEYKNGILVISVEKCVYMYT